MYEVVLDDEDLAMELFYSLPGGATKSYNADRIRSIAL